MKYQLKAYWWSHPCEQSVFNFGDLLTPLLLKHYCKDLELIPRKRENATLFGIGSIIPAVNPKRFSVLLGCGALSEKKTKLPNALIYALRGELSKKMLHISEDIPLGDPGLLAPYVLQPSKIISNKENKPIGIIPHFKQYANKKLDCFRNDANYKIINVRAEAECVIQEICSCSSIISSSLHGLIIADAYNIPNIRLNFEDSLYDVNDFKFIDYFSSIKRCGEAARSITPEQINTNIKYDTTYFANVHIVQESLNCAFNKFVSELPVIQFLSEVDEILQKYVKSELRDKYIPTIISSIKANNKHNNYDKIIHLSGLYDALRSLYVRLKIKRIFCFGERRKKIKNEIRELKSFLVKTKQ